MKTFSVAVPIIAWVTIENVQAENAEDAEEKALSELYVCGFCGNGGTNKLIGVTGVNESIEAGGVADVYNIDVWEQ